MNDLLSNPFYNPNEVSDNNNSVAQDVLGDVSDPSNDNSQISQLDRSGYKPEFKNPFHVDVTTKNYSLS